MLSLPAGLDHNVDRYHLINKHEKKASFVRQAIISPCCLHVTGFSDVWRLPLPRLSWKTASCNTAGARVCVCVCVSLSRRGMGKGTGQSYVRHVVSSPLKWQTSCCYLSPCSCMFEWTISLTNIYQAAKSKAWQIKSKYYFKYIANTNLCTYFSFHYVKISSWKGFYSWFFSVSVNFLNIFWINGFIHLPCITEK